MRVLRSESTALLLAVALGAAQWLGARPDRPPGQSWITVADVAAAAVVGSALALWLKDGDRAAGRLAVVAPLTSLAAVLALALPAVTGDGNPLALGAACAQAASCFAVTGFARARSRDWRLDASATGFAVATLLPWFENPRNASFYPGYGERGSWDAWAWFATYDSVWPWLGGIDVLFGLAVVSALAAGHFRAPFSDPAMAARAAAVALAAAVGGVTWSLAQAEDLGIGIEPRLGVPFSLAALAALLAVSVRRPGRAPAPTRRGP